MFASAVHGYAFSLDDFADIWAPKLSIDRSTLLQNLFLENTYLNGLGSSVEIIKTFLASKEIKLDSKGKRISLFEQLVLKPIWEIHKYGLIEKQIDKLKEFAVKLSIPTLKSRRIDDAFDEFMRLFLPLTRATVRAIAKCKSPEKTFSDESRLLNFVSSRESKLWPLIQNSDPNSDCCLVYVAKLLMCEKKKVAITRILSGTLTNGNFSSLDFIIFQM